MFRLAVAVLLVVGGFSLYFATRPIRETPPRPPDVRLEGVQMTLYPAEDPKAHWVFTARQVLQNPATGSALIEGLEGGARYVGERLSLRLQAPSLQMDRLGNLTLPYAQVEILQGCFSVDLGGPGQAPVRINQRQGFWAPTVDIHSPTIEVRAHDFTSDFAIESPSWSDGVDQWRSVPLPCTIPGASG